VDKLLGALETLLPLDRGFQVLILGSGDRGSEQALIRLAENETNRGRLCFLQGYDPAVATQVYAAGDFFLIPSRYEPCGLTDYMAQLFGNLPIVHHVGGLVKVVDGVTGLAYREHQSAALMGALTAQKGVDKLLGALETLLPLDRGFQVLILGSGDRSSEQALIRLAENEANRGRLCFLQGYDPAVATQVYAAGDFFLIPSRYEPCGLTDYMAQLFGNLPIVHHVGGLVKVVDGVTGLAYREHQSAALMGAMQRALILFRREPEKILDMRRAAVQHIQEHYTWNRVMNQYLDFYQRAQELV